MPSQLECLRRTEHLEDTLANITSNSMPNRRITARPVTVFAVSKLVIKMLF